MKEDNMRLTAEGAIELEGGRVVFPWYLEGADWREDDLSSHGLTEEEVTEAKSLMTDEAKATFIRIYGADSRE